MGNITHKNPDVIPIIRISRALRVGTVSSSLAYNTSNQFVGHLANDVLPSTIAKLDETLVVTGRHLSSRT
jgi:hypothetical protein